MKKQLPLNKRFVIGVTGGIASGKTTVSAMLESLGAKVIDADRIARTVVSRGKPAYRKLVAAFGRGILRPDGDIDRKKLADEAFSCREKLAQLNSITHPYILKEVHSRLDKSSGVVVIDAPLLVETGLYRLADRVIAVKSNKRLQLERAGKNKALSPGRERVLKIMRVQAPFAVKARLADFIIDNSGSLDKTKEQIESLRRTLWRNWI